MRQLITAALAVAAQLRRSNKWSIRWLRGLPRQRKKRFDNVAPRNRKIHHLRLKFSHSTTLPPILPISYRTRGNLGLTFNQNLGDPTLNPVAVLGHLWQVESNQIPFFGFLDFYSTTGFFGGSPFGQEWDWQNPGIGDFGNSWDLTLKSSTPVPAPEPTSALLVGVACGLLSIWRYRRRFASSGSFSKPSRIGSHTRPV